VHTRDGLVRQAIQVYEETFSAHPLCVATAPGRVNLIGEHTDYNLGVVLPAAINRCIAIAAGPRTDDQLVIHSETMNDLVQVTLGDLRPLKYSTWSNYLTGVAFFLQRRGANLRGANISVSGNIPQAAGLSSSAALEIASAFAFTAMNDLHFSDIDLIRLCQQAENEFVGVSCGIMDQFVSCMGKQHQALYLDCRTLLYKHVGLPEEVSLLVCNTGVQRELSRSEYNKRRQECLFGVKQLATRLPGIESLRDVSWDQFMTTRHLLTPVIEKRCRHVLSENGRVRAAVDALERRDVVEFGKLMYQSHFSLRNDYEVSSPELDAVVDICAESDGVYGARMTGAGFGGSAICLVDNGAVEGVSARLLREYPKRTNKLPTIYVCRFEDGASIDMV